jgi:hypothetical protein
MNFGANTISILKNFSTINPSISFRKGNNLKTVSPLGTILASATIEESIPSSAAIYDISRFLATINLMTNPVIEFQDKKFVISDSKSNLHYKYAAESMIAMPPESTKELPKGDVEFFVQWDDINNVIKAASILQLNEISFIGDGKNVKLSAINTKDSNADTYDIKIADTDLHFNMILKVDNLKLMPFSYTVALSTKGVAHFKSENVQYWIALEKNSKLGV